MIPGTVSNNPAPSSSQGKEFFFSLERFGVKLGLDNISRLLERLDNPQKTWPAVHVGGTNGKGSVLAFLDAVFQAAGYKTGRFVSPHLMDVNERFLYCGHPIPESELLSILDTLQSLVQGTSPLPTFFEYCTAIAFEWFREKKVDVGLVEVGMGGRFDSTNVLEPRVAGIVSVDLEHTRFLGDTLEAIAREKAGIMKPDIPVVCMEQKKEAREVLVARAKEVKSPIKLPGRDFSFTSEGDVFNLVFSYQGARFQIAECPLGLAGTHQSENAACAVAMGEILAEQFPLITQDAVQQGLQNARWPCRLERVLDEPVVYIDVAHNPAGVQRLVTQLRDAIYVIAVSSDKNVRAMLELFSRAAHELIVTQFDGHRAFPCDKLSAVAGEIPHIKMPDMAEAITAAIERAAGKRPVVIAGSIFFAGQARRLLMEEFGAFPMSF